MEERVKTHVLESMYIALGQELRDSQDSMEIFEDWRDGAEVTIEDMAAKLDDVELDVDASKARIESLESQVNALSRTCEILVSFNFEKRRPVIFNQLLASYDLHTRICGGVSSPSQLSQPWLGEACTTSRL